MVLDPPRNSEMEAGALNSINCTAAEAAEQAEGRKYVFAEFFAGMGGFAAAVGFICEGQVKVASILDAYEGEWDILTEDGLAKGKLLCQEIDHGHFAPPCRTLTEARRDDEHGCVKQLRSFSHPEGWGDEDTILANKIIERMVMLCLILHNRGRTFSIENPFGSFLWLMKVMLKLMRLGSAELVLLHQCCYGALTVKPTGILTTSPWVKKVRALCHEVRAHRHLRGGLAGKTWSYLEECVVWRSSLAAEYPCGLCVAWARALKEWLAADSGKLWMAQNSYILTGQWRNVLVRKDYGFEETATKVASKKETREQENSQAIGGLRCARRSVARSSSLRQVGRIIRSVLDSCRSEEVLSKWESNITQGFPKEYVDMVRNKLCHEFGADPTPSSTGLRTDLWRKLLSQADDCEAEIIPQWFTEGCPLGIRREIAWSGAFPQTSEDTAAVEASKLEGRFMEDTAGNHQNYVSFNEAGMKAQKHLDIMVQNGRAECFRSWEAVVTKYGPECRLTKLACLIKIKDDGTEKVRLVVDSKRSGVNGMAFIRERVVLPRVSDIAASWTKLLAANYSNAEAELCSMDFVDAFHTLPLAADEQPFTIVKGLDSVNGSPQYYVFKVVVFGLAAGPLLWGRTAAAAMRLAQAVAGPSESDVSTYVDDPLIIAVSPYRRERSWMFARYALVWAALGLELSWPKAQRGAKLQWIGFDIHVHDVRSQKLLTVTLAESKRKKLADTISELQACKGMIPLQKLQLATGILGWVTSAIPSARPWLAMMWAALLAQRNPVRPTTRIRKGLIFVKQVEHALRWIAALVNNSCSQHGTLSKVYRWSPEAPTCMIQTDASPFGLGGFLVVGTAFIAFWHDVITPDDTKLLGAQVGDPAFQSELELLAFLVSLRVFKQWLQNQNSPARIIFRGDNSSTLEAIMQHRAGSPIMVQLAAEVSLELEALEIPHVWAHHVPGILNDVADALSRMSQGHQLPAVLKEATYVQAPARNRDFYRAWPPTK